MSVGNAILYLKGSQCVEVKNRNVTIGDMFSMECTHREIIPKLKSMKILKIPDKGCHRYVISILTIIECIHKEFPNVQVQNMGSPDIIVVYEDETAHNIVAQGCKIAFVALLAFIGSAFAIMTFNNDSGIPKLFSEIYELIMGKPHNGFGVLELTYSIGLVLGIIVFFNHFGKRRLSVDPTPIEVEMRLYENDLQTTVISDYSRKGHDVDVD